MNKLSYLLCFSLLLVCLSLVVPTKTFALTGPVNPYSFSVEPGPQSGSTTIRWYDDRSATSYNLLYGTDPNNYSFGVVGLPDSQNTSNAFTVNSLTPGQTYYFSLIGITGSTPNYSGPVAAAATGADTTQASQPPTSHLPEYGFTAQPGGDSGTVTVNWTDNDTADKYDIVYGTTPGSLVYGVQNVPLTHNTTNSYTIGALQPGQTYYFSLVAEKNGSIVLWSDPVSALAK